MCVVDSIIVITMASIWCALSEQWHNDGVCHFTTAKESYFPKVPFIVGVVVSLRDLHGWQGMFIFKLGESMRNLAWWSKGIWNGFFQYFIKLKT